MSTNSYSIVNRAVFLSFFFALVSPAWSFFFCIPKLGIGCPPPPHPPPSKPGLLIGADCSKQRTGCYKDFVCLHNPRVVNMPYRCAAYQREGAHCLANTFRVCKPHLRCIGGCQTPFRFGTCVPPSLPVPEGGFCQSHTRCKSGFKCVKKGKVGHCVRTGPPTPTPSPSSSLTPKPSPSRSPMPTPSRPPSHSPMPLPSEYPSVDSQPPILDPERKKRLQEKIKKAGGCNANVCFAIDGSKSISTKEFGVEKRFVQDVVSVLTGFPVEVAAVQFSTSTYPIQKLTVDDEQFILKVENTKQIPGRSFIGGGLNFCYKELRRRKDESMTVVLLSDGQNNVGNFQYIVSKANGFRRGGGDICVVGAGDQAEKKLKRIAGLGEESCYYQVKNLFDYEKLADHIEQITLSICSIYE